MLQTVPRYKGWMCASFEILGQSQPGPLHAVPITSPSETRPALVCCPSDASPIFELAALNSTEHRTLKPRLRVSPPADHALSCHLLDSTMGPSITDAPTQTDTAGYGRTPSSRRRAMFQPFHQDPHRRIIQSSELSLTALLRGSPHALRARWSKRLLPLS